MDGAEPLLQIFNLAKVRISLWKATSSQFSSPKHLQTDVGEKLHTHQDNVTLKAEVSNQNVKNRGRLASASDSKPTQTNAKFELTKKTAKSKLKIRINSQEEYVNTTYESASAELSSSPKNPDSITLLDSGCSMRKGLLASPSQAVRLGNIYLFNSLPQPTPRQSPSIDSQSTEDRIAEKRRGSFQKNTLSPFPVLLDPVRTPISPRSIQRVSVDRHFIHEMSEHDLRMKAALACVSPPAITAKCKPPNLLSPMPITQWRGFPHKTPSPRPSPVTDELSSMAPPLDLGEYDQSDDLSASFEASLLASLKEAAMQSSGSRQSDLELYMETPGIRTEFHPVEVNVTEPEGRQTVGGTRSSLRPQAIEGLPTRNHRYGPFCTPGTPETPLDYENRPIALQEMCQTDMSFSDNDDEEDEVSMTTTTAGLGPLMHILPQSAQQRMRANTTELNRVHERLNRVPTKTQVHITQGDSLDETTAVLMTDSDSGDSQFNDSIDDSKHGNLESSYSEPNLLIASPSHFPGTRAKQMKQSVHPLEDQAQENEAMDLKDTMLEVLYDPILDCYYDPESGSYYQLK